MLLILRADDGKLSLDSRRYKKVIRDNSMGGRQSRSRGVSPAPAQSTSIRAEGTKFSEWISAIETLCFKPVSTILLYAVTRSATS
jgi:hypothetical protein